jgi:hypothetical protein
MPPNCLNQAMENADEKLSTRMRRLLDFLWQEWNTGSCGLRA